MQESDAAVTESLSSCEIDGAPISVAEQELLRLVKLVTENASRVCDADIQRLRAAGWTDPQIAEAVYITALFAFFNRVADAFGLDDPGYRDQGPPDD